MPHAMLDANQKAPNNNSVQGRFSDHSVRTSNPWQEDVAAFYARARHCLMLRACTQTAEAMRRRAEPTVVAASDVSAVEPASSCCAALFDERTKHWPRALAQNRHFEIFSSSSRQYRREDLARLCPQRRQYVSRVRYRLNRGLQVLYCTCVVARSSGVQAPPHALVRSR